VFVLYVRFSIYVIFTRNFVNSMYWFNVQHQFTFNFRVFLLCMFVGLNHNFDKGLKVIFDDFYSCYPPTCLCSYKFMVKTGEVMKQTSSHPGRNQVYLNCTSSSSIYRVYIFIIKNRITSDYIIWFINISVPSNVIQQTKTSCTMFSFYKGKIKFFLKKLLKVCLILITQRRL
jgi:hypothetical protein